MGRNFLRDVAVVVVAILVVVLLLRMPRWWSGFRSAEIDQEQNTNITVDQWVVANRNNHCTEAALIVIPRKPPFVANLPQPSQNFPTPDYDGHLQMHYEETEKELVKKDNASALKAGEFSLNGQTLTFSQDDAGQRVVTNDNNWNCTNKPSEN